MFCNEHCTWMPFDTISAIQCNSTLFDAIRCCSMLFDAFQYYSIKFSATQCYSVPSILFDAYAILFDSTQFNSSPFDAICLFDTIRCYSKPVQVHVTFSPVQPNSVTFSPNQPNSAQFCRTPKLVNFTQTSSTH